MTGTGQTVFCRFPSNDSLAAARYWNTPTSRSARKPTPEFTNERSTHSSTGRPEQEGQNSRRLRFAANRGVDTLPTDPPSQVYQYTGRHQWRGADFQVQPESEG
jgi:hypothetical protein